VENSCCTTTWKKNKSWSLDQLIIGLAEKWHAIHYSVANTQSINSLFVPEELPWGSALQNLLVNEMSRLHKEYQELRAPQLSICTNYLS
jgi:hypothetical protein